MDAIIIYSGRSQDGEVIAVNGHEIQFGGSGGDGFCYIHQSFNCLDNLTEEERKSIQNAKEV